MERRTHAVMAVFGIAAAAALALPACGDFEIACYTDQNCEAGQRCVGGQEAQQVQGRCVAGDDGAGGSGSGATSTGSTIPKPVSCTNDAGCPIGQFCDQDSKTCRTCDTNDHCGEACLSCAGLTPCCVLGVCSALGC